MLKPSHIEISHSFSLMLCFFLSLSLSFYHIKYFLCRFVFLSHSHYHCVFYLHDERAMRIWSCSSAYRQQRYRWAPTQQQCPLPVRVLLRHAHTPAHILHTICIAVVLHTFGLQISNGSCNVCNPVQFLLLCRSKNSEAFAWCSELIKK